VVGGLTGGMVEYMTSQHVSVVLPVRADGPGSVQTHTNAYRTAGQQQYKPIIQMEDLGLNKCSSERKRMVPAQLNRHRERERERETAYVCQYC
jgi:hypothetical protein